MRKELADLRKELGEARKEIKTQKAANGALQSQLQRSYATIHEANTEGARNIRENKELKAALAAAEEREREAVAWIREACAYFEKVRGGLPDVLRR